MTMARDDMECILNDDLKWVWVDKWSKEPLSPFYDSQDESDAWYDAVYACMIDAYFKERM